MSNTTNPLSAINTPFFYAKKIGEKPRPEDVQRQYAELRADNKEPSFLNRRTPADVMAGGVGLIGIVLAIYGLIKQDFLKLIGSIAFLGGLIWLGLNKWVFGVDLSKRAIEATIRSPQVKIQEHEDKEILQRSQGAIERLSDDVADDLKLDKVKLRKLMPKAELMDSNDPMRKTHLAYYDGETHSVKINPRISAFKRTSIEGISRHEARHAVEAILRTCLSESRAKELILSQITDEIKNGGQTEILGDKGIVETPAIPSREVRNVVAQFVRDLIKEPEKYKDILDEKTCELGKEKIGFQNINESGRQELKKRLSTVDDKYQMLIPLYGDDDTALYVFSKYIDANLYRYSLAIGNHRETLGVSLRLPSKVLKVDIKLTDKAEKFAEESARGFLACMDGNYLSSYYGQLGLLTKIGNLAYTFCAEEVRCQREQIKADREQDTLIDQDVKEKLYGLGERLMQLRKQLPLAPKDQNKYSVWMKHFALGYKMRDAHTELMFKLGNCLNDLAKKGIMKPGKESMSQEEERFKEAGRIWMEVGAKLSLEQQKAIDQKGNYLERMTELVEREYRCLANVGDCLIKIDNGSADNVAEILSFGKKRKDLLLEYPKSMLNLYTNVVCNDDAVEIELLDRTDSGNVELVRKIYEIEAEILRLLPTAGVTTIHPDNFKSVPQNWLSEA